MTDLLKAFVPLGFGLMLDRCLGLTYPKTFVFCSEE